MWSDGSGALDVSDSLVSMLVYNAEEGRCYRVAAWKSIGLCTRQDGLERK